LDTIADLERWRPGMEEVGVTYSSVLVVPGSAC
jgi:hypothetical protein